MRYAYAIGRRIMGAALPRLIRVSKENAIGVFVLIAGIAYAAHLHTWSRETFLGNIWETALAPCLLVLCLLFFFHLLQSARVLYNTQRRPFVNALGTTTSIPPMHFRWRFYVITIAYLTVPMTLVVKIWFPISTIFTPPPFVVNPNTNLVVPDLHVLNAIPYTPPPEKDHPPSLLDLFTNDYPEDFKAQNNVTMKGSSLPLKQQVYLDLLGKSKFVGFYVPTSQLIDDEENTVVICEDFAREVQPMLDTLPKNLELKGGYGMSNAADLRDLTFTHLAVIYHQSILSITEQAAVISAFKSYGVDVQFRGPDYEASRMNSWVYSHKKQ